MSHSPCHYDCSDFPDPDVTDIGCCSPHPIRKDCEAPAIPAFQCDEEEPVVEYDEDTEEFTVTTTMYDSECSALLDSADSPLLSLIA
jgi:hypothetical protein